MTTINTDLASAVLQAFVSGKELSDKRKASTIKERTTPCQCCQYPISHRHHPFGFKNQLNFGIVLNLCPNCHELYHIAEKRFIGQPGNKTIESFAELMRFKAYRDRALWCLYVIDQVHETSHFERLKKVFKEL